METFLGMSKMLSNITQKFLHSYEVVFPDTSIEQ